MIWKRWSFHCWEMSLHLLGFFWFFLPSGSNGLPLSKELNCTLAVKVCNSSEAVFSTSEREHREWNWNWKINSNLSWFNFMLELSGSVAVLSENSGSIAPSVFVDDINTFLQGLYSNNNHNWSKNFIIIYWHAWSSVINNSWANEVTVFIA